ncbi:MAG: hypothetical protein EPO24_00245 [Bacteroidetes bacterium]|nr:MAG: hypothetical protein EPO24_00245 [Bacteroidota bacterium]
MKHIVLWITAFIITACSAIYQRVTGPTYPVNGEIRVGSIPLNYSFPRSHGGETNCPVEIQTNEPSVTGTIDWKRYNTNDDWTTVRMTMSQGFLKGELPHQPPAGKLQYRVNITAGDNTVSITDGEGIIVRFKGDVPLFVLIPHVIMMFGGMLLSTRTGFELFTAKKNLKKLMYWTLGFLVFGGFVLGPIVQKYAFGDYWTGWPYGTDLTDNKTAIAIISWLVALAMFKRSRVPARWAFAASVVTLAIFLIPHSLLGSELDYQNQKR